MRVLIIEDNIQVAELLAAYIKPIASEIRIANDEASARAELEKVPPAELISLDLSLPDSTTEQTLAKILEMKLLHPDCVLVVVTGMVDPEAEERVLQAGADGYLYKPSALRNADAFLRRLSDVARAILRVPRRYTKNLSIAEELTRRIKEHFGEAHP